MAILSLGVGAGCADLGIAEVDIDGDAGDRNVVVVEDFAFDGDALFGGFGVFGARAHR
jgi:hypothetical protein